MKSLVRRTLFGFVSSSAHFVWWVLMKQLAEFGFEWEGLVDVICGGCVVECHSQGHELGGREKGGREMTQMKREGEEEGGKERGRKRRRQGGRNRCRKKKGRE